jgi:hypothetical protein
MQWFRLALMCALLAALTGVAIQDTQIQPGSVAIPTRISAFLRSALRSRK